jgi:uncharacterized protein with LGFP repeats
MESVSVRTATGEIIIRGPVYAKWRALGAVKTPDGDTAQAHLCDPRGPETRVSEERGAGAVQLFQRGMIVARATGETFVIYGAIYDHYIAMGGVKSALGLPTSDEEDAPRGCRVNRFENGDIYWRADFGARDVQGATRNRCAKGEDPFARSWVRRVVSLCRRIVTGRRTSAH